MGPNAGDWPGINGIADPRGFKNNPTGQADQSPKTQYFTSRLLTLAAKSEYPGKPKY
jgi:hypothetical protein